MTVSPKKHILKVASSTANRGVEAKEIEIVNINLASASEQRCGRRGASPEPSPSPPPPPSPSPPSRDDSASYIQVLVQKQRRRRGLPTPRLPRPSSPVCLPSPASPPPSEPVKEHVACVSVQTQRHASHQHAPIQPNGYHKRCECLSRSTWPEAVLPFPGMAAMHRSCEATQAAHEQSAGRAHHAAPPPSKHKLSLWQRVSNFTKEDLGYLDLNGPERLDVYRFESGVASLSARGVAPTRLERALRRRARPAARLLRELVAAPRLAAALPAALLLLSLRTALAATRDVAIGLVQAASDYALKPALVVSFNALLRPVLVFAAQMARAVREALSPLSLALDDAVAPAARLLASVRLVHVERHCDCSYAHTLHAV